MLWFNLLTPVRCFSYDSNAFLGRLHIPILVYMPRSSMEMAFTQHLSSKDLPLGKRLEGRPNDFPDGKEGRPDINHL